jgi:hypothetical protein
MPSYAITVHFVNDKVAVSNLMISSVTINFLVFQLYSPDKYQIKMIVAPFADEINYDATPKNSERQLYTSPIELEMKNCRNGFFSRTLQNNAICS